MATRWYTPEEASSWLWDNHRIKRSSRRLAQLRALGTGPKFHRDGGVARYHEEDLDAWAEVQLGEAFQSTAEESAHHQAASAAKKLHQRNRGA